MKCYFVHDKELGKVLIPHCYSVVNSNNIEDCTCSEITFNQFENKRYQKTLEKLKVENLELKEIIKTLSDKNHDKSHLKTRS